MISISFKPKKVMKDLISGLNERTQDVISQRYGLGDMTERKTLEAIGQQYGITRERVRQIENFAIKNIKQSQAFDTHQGIFDELKTILDDHGKIVAEHKILDRLTQDESLKNYIYFLLVLGDDFTKLKEDEYFHARWTTDCDHADCVHNALTNLHSSINENDLLSEEEVVSALKKHVDGSIQKKASDEIVRSWLDISKVISDNALGEWGPSYSSNINPRGMRDYAFLVLRKHGSPLHFTEIADQITNHFSRKANASTVHNELIKDNNFVLVGRGLYALEDWGYKSGTVRDIIKAIIDSNKPLTKEEIIKSVLRERYIKENTILVNLQNRRFFKRGGDGTYVVVS